MSIGIVTVTYNSASVLDEFFESLFAQDFPEFVLYLIDNASSDGTRGVVERHLGDTRLRATWQQENVGIARGNNTGIAQALADGCDHVLLLNNDTVFGPDLISEMLRQSRALEADLLVPKMYFHEAPGLLWYAGGTIVPWRAYAAPHDGFAQVDHGQFDTARRVVYAPTCCMLVKREVFERVGLMDPDFFVYCDDTDFCIRLNKHGAALWYAPSPTLRHKVASLTGRTSPFSLRMLTRGRVHLMRKHGPTWALPYQFAVLHAEMFARVLLKGERVSDFLARERGFREGLAIAIRSSNEPPAAHSC